MKNKWFLVNIAVAIWGLLADSLFTPRGYPLTHSMYQIVARMISPKILGIPSMTVLFTVFTVLYICASYQLIFADESDSLENYR